MATAPNNEAVSIVIEWLDAMRRGDCDATAECFRPSVTWRGIVPDAVCRDRIEVLDMLEDRLAVGTPRAETVELIRGDTGVVLGVRSDDLQVIADVRVPRQLYNVFEIRDGRIAAVRDFVRRRDALHAAGATEPQWM
jgi:ketosteroid isomerase-like protein